MPVNFFDKVGRERRELDEIERNEELPTGKPMLSCISYSGNATSSPDLPPIDSVTRNN
jgi:hypothetical protein